MQNTKKFTQSLGGALLVHVAIATSFLLLTAYFSHAVALTTTSANETIRIRLQPQRPQNSLVKQLQECNCINQANRTTYYKLSGAIKHDAGQIQLGTPPQAFEFLFDTGSDIIWVTHSKCRLNGNPWDSRSRQKFAIDKSSTFKRIDRDRVQLKYANQMEFDGWWIQDTLRVSDSQDDSRSLTVPNQALALICFIKGRKNHYDDGFDGLIGLGFRSRNSKNSNTLLENMILDGLLKEPVFSFYTSHTSTDVSVTQQRRSELVFGQVDPALYTGPITWTPVTKLSYWEIRVHSITLMPRETNHGADAHEPAAVACIHGCEAAVDTGTSMMVGPAAEVARLNEKLGFVRNGQDNDLYLTHGPCAMHINQDMLLVFELNGALLELEAQQFMFDVDEGGVKVCLSSLASHPPGQERLPWILGAPFISSFYTIFDYGHKRVGFAKPAIATLTAPGLTHRNQDEAGPSSRAADTLAV